MTKHRSPDERADQILMAARTCFLEKGYFATKMDAIAQESGLSKGGIYFHFDSKREIFRALVQHEYDTTMGIIDGVLSSNNNIGWMMVQLAEHFMTLFAGSDAPRFMVIVVEMGLRDEEIARLLRKLQVNYFERVASLLDAGAASGEIRAVDSYACAVVLKALIDGVQANFAIGIDLEFERVVAAGVELLARGFAPDPS